MRCTCDHEDHLRYWLTKSIDHGKQIRDKVSRSPVDQNQKSIIALLNYQEFSFKKFITFKYNSKDLLIQC